VVKPDFETVNGSSFWEIPYATNGNLSISVDFMENLKLIRGATR
jgi:hypothetical protein